MLLKEDGHLDIEKVEKLSEEDLDKEMDSWTDRQWYEWDTRFGVITPEELFARFRRKMNESVEDNERHFQG